MGRWRPPQPKSAAYITPEGYERLETEAKELWLRRRVVVKALSEAAAEGDRSENAEYIYRKKELRGIDRRIRYLQNRMPDLNVVPPREDNDRIFFGAWVDLEMENGDSVTYRIVGADEIDPKLGYISLDSPMSKQLLGKRLDDEITLKLPEKISTYWVTGIRYI